MAGARLLEQGENRRERILMFCRMYQDMHGYGPSIAEIANGVKLASKTTVRHHLLTLQEEGRIVMTPGKYRSLRVCDD